jgi:transcriptional regulator with XRE-family HTH domain
MSTIGEKLRYARESQERSLDDIATATRINRKFLACIEEGKAPNLPHTYIRAFIKAYAEQVGLNAQELLNQTDNTKPEASTDDHASPAFQTVTSSNLFTSVPGDSKRLGGNPKRKILLFFSVFLIVALALSVYLMRRQNSLQQVREIAFDDVVKEWEGKKLPAEQQAGSVLMGSAPMVDSPSRDSLTLLAIVSDSTWLHLVIDNSKSQEQILMPHSRMRWKAKKNFLFSLGNAGGISFILNGKDLGHLGQRGKPMKNISLSWKTLEDTQDSSALRRVNAKH